MNCADCKYSHDTGTALLCWGQRFAPPVDPDHFCKGWKPRNINRTNYDNLISKSPEKMAIFLASVNNCEIAFKEDDWLCWLNSLTEEWLKWG